MTETASITDRVAAVGGLINEVLLSVASMTGPDPEMNPRARTDDRLRELLVGLERVRPEQGYRPSAALDRAVRVRDVTCRFPGCRRAALGTATGTDIDHAVSWPVGCTVASNLAVLCRRHHRLKHTAGWRVELNADTTMTWTTSSGRAYTSELWHYPNASSSSSPAPTESVIAGVSDPVIEVPDPPPRQWPTSSRCPDTRPEFEP